MLFQAGPDTAALGRETELAVSQQAIVWMKPETPLQIFCRFFFSLQHTGGFSFGDFAAQYSESSCFSKLFSLVSDLFFSLLIWSPTWEYGCYRMFSTSLRQAAADWGSHFTQGNYVRFSESLLTEGKDCFSLWECQLEPFITWMTCNVIKIPAKTHSILSRCQFWRQCLSFQPSDSSSSG